MRFGDHFMEELKARVRVSDVVGRSVKLKRRRGFTTAFRAESTATRLAF